MQTIGYQLVRVADGGVVQQWGGSFDGLCGKPGVLYLPSGEHVHCPELGGEYFGYRLDEWRAERDLAAYKAHLKARIDREAEEARLRYITAGAGQALEYQEAAEEAVRYAATGGAGAYPMLQASVDAGEAPDLATAATLIGARENAWATIGATIRRLRLTAKRAVDAATSVDEVAAAATVAWP
jgi:hypothetical protein